MNYKKIFKRETKVIAYVVIALTLVVIGTSYALFLQVNNNQDNQVVTAGSLVVTYSNGNVVTVNENDKNNCLTPQSDAMGSSTGGCNFTLSITNKGTLPMQYDLLIYDDVNNEELPNNATFVNHDLVRHSLKKQYSKEGENPETVTSAKALSELDLKEGKKVLETSTINVGETITFSLNIWISDEAPVAIIGQYVYLKLDVIGSVSGYDNFNNYIINLSKTDTSIEKFEHEATEQTKALTDYRYIGSNPNNYVCFGSEEETCPTDNLYRIIGVMPTQESVGGTYENRVKLIKADFYAEEESGLANNSAAYRFSVINSNSDSWEHSPVNTEVLNKIYWNKLGIYQNYVAESLWYLGAATGDNNYTIDLLYTDERGKLHGYDSEKINVVLNIGLLYASDVLYTKNGESNNAWLRLQDDEWTMTVAYNTGNRRALVHNYNNNSVYKYVVTSFYKIRPTFYLKSNVLYKSGDGSIKTPYRIAA